jgi:superfamily II DNA/RNA helicase
LDDTQAIQAFTDLPLHDRLFKALEAKGFDKPTPVQAQAIPEALANKDLAVSAETGSGKTAAFVLPILHKLLEKDAPKSGTRALILAPTRELARQIFKNVKDLSAFTRLQAAVISGGQEFKFQKALFRKNPEIIIATPGRLVEHIEKGSTDFDDLEVLVIDEADRMFDMGLVEDVLKIAEACPDRNTGERQTLLFSATLENSFHLPRVMERVLVDPVTLSLAPKREANQNITQQIVLSDDDRHKSMQTDKLLKDHDYDKAVVFTNTKAGANKLAGWLRYRDVKVGVLHGDMDQDARNQEMNRLRRGGIKVLVATDVASRGLDVNGIDLVINFDMPRDGDDYIHRIGRTGRAGESGLAISLINSSEWNLMARIERYIKGDFKRIVVKGLEAKYKGPEKVKSSGKAAGKKKSKTATKGKNGKNDSKPKTKVRARDTKNIGKRREPSARKKFGDEV